MGKVTYDIISLIISAVGAIATFSAVVVALWQTKYANRKKLKCSFSDNVIIVDNYNNIKKYVGIIITNIGNKRVIVNSWSVKTKNGFLQFLTDLNEITDSDIIDRRLSAEMKTPHVLETEEQITFYFPYDLFCKNIKELTDKGNICSDEKILFVVKDSTGREYKTKSNEIGSKYMK